MKTNDKVRKFTQEEKSNIISSFQLGVGITKLAKDYDTTYSKIRTILEKAGVYVARGSTKPKQGKNESSKGSKKPRQNNSKSYTSKVKSKSGSKSSEQKVITLEEKIAYCNKKYGKGKWHFATKEELLELFQRDLNKSGKSSSTLDFEEDDCDLSEEIFGLKDIIPHIEREIDY